MRPDESTDPELAGDQAVVVDDIPMLRIRCLEDAQPGLVAGITTRFDVASAATNRGGRLDFGLATGGDWWSVSERYARLATGLGFSSAAVCRQVHGNVLASVADAPRAGLWVSGNADGMIDPPDRCLLVVTVADCVPVYMFEPETASLGLLHAGWRGAAAGIMRHGIERITAGMASRLEGLRIHFGPAICGDCYEVGPEVRRALDLDEQETTGLDLREFLRHQAMDSGVSMVGITESPVCTRCDAERFHSHRAAGEVAGRMAAFLGRTA